MRALGRFCDKRGRACLIRAGEFYAASFAARDCKRRGRDGDDGDDKCFAIAVMTKISVKSSNASSVQPSRFPKRALRASRLRPEMGGN